MVAPYHHHHRFVAGCLPGHTDQSNLKIRLYINDIQTYYRLPIKWDIEVMEIRFIVIQLSESLRITSHNITHVRTANYNHFLSVIQDEI